MVPDEKLLIEQALRGMRSRQPGLPADQVKLFIAQIGEIIEPTSKIDQAEIDEFVRQLKAG